MKPLHHFILTLALLPLGACALGAPICEKRLTYSAHWERLDIGEGRVAAGESIELCVNDACKTALLSELRVGSDGVPSLTDTTCTWDKFMDVSCTVGQVRVEGPQMDFRVPLPNSLGRSGGTYSVKITALRKDGTRASLAHGTVDARFEPADDVCRDGYFETSHIVVDR